MLTYSRSPSSLAARPKKPNEIDGNGALDEEGVEKEEIGVAGEPSCSSCSGAACVLAGRVRGIEIRNGNWLLTLGHGSLEVTPQIRQTL